MFRKRFDFFLFLPVLFLWGFGLAMMASVSSNNFLNHLIYVILSLIFFLIFSFFDLEILFPFTPLIYIFNLFFLCLPFLLGTVTRGSLRWIPLGNLTIQPSELVKPFLALMASWFWSKEEFSFKRFFSFIGFSLPLVLLVFFQPDLGSALVILSILAGITLFSGISSRQVFFLILILVLVLPIGWFFLHDYQRNRITHFLNPYADPLGEGYNLIQSKIAVGSGGFWGRGFGRGTQSHLAFLPERHTDFIFASLTEELGLVGGTAVLFLYFLLFMKILKIAAGCQEKKYFLLCLGIFASFFSQTVINIGMNIGLLPVAGVTLPLISYGGSSLLASGISLGMLQAVSRQRGEEIIEIK